VNPNYVDINVAEQETRADSILNYYKALIALRKSEAYREAFTYGVFRPLFADEDNILAYCRTGDTREAVVIANFGAEPKTLPAAQFRGYQLLLSNAPADVTADTITLKSAQVIVLGN